eukprot:TRINITY_DN66956_c10_g4_i1.p1 TRINITY_DN66956_c10_g4~~TRINITY_DN66956_c10_g4_i1.p1  ORF type:complete len:415 (+),score=18.91 TRINITY_DN66956_c10_g4_i1:63-1247(+)
MAFKFHLLFVVLMVQCANGMRPNDVPNPTPYSWVSDPLNMLRSDTKRAIDAGLTQLDRDLGFEIAIAMIDRMGGPYNIEDFSRELFDMWGIGKADVNNGVLLIIARDDRKMRIQTGRGAREVITDSRASKIIDKMKPALRKNDPDYAVEFAVNAMIDLCRGGNQFIDDGSSDTFIVLLVVIVVVVILLCICNAESGPSRSEFERRMGNLSRLAKDDYRVDGGVMCSVCLETITRESCENTENPVVMLKCNHPFHYKCIVEWLQRKNTCPLCRCSNPIQTGPQAPQYPAPHPPRRNWNWGSGFGRRRYWNPPPSYFYHADYDAFSGYNYVPFYTTNRLHGIQQDMFHNYARDYNYNVHNGEFTWTRRVVESSSSSSSSSFGGGSSSGGGGSSGSW